MVVAAEFFWLIQSCCSLSTVAKEDRALWEWLVCCDSCHGLLLIITQAALICPSKHQTISQHTDTVNIANCVKNSVFLWSSSVFCGAQGWYNPVWSALLYSLIKVPLLTHSTRSSLFSELAVIKNFIFKFLIYKTFHSNTNMIGQWFFITLASHVPAEKDSWSMTCQGEAMENPLTNTLVKELKSQVFVVKDHVCLWWQCV